MATLHIEHAITDFDTWRGAFERFAEARRAAGVTGGRVARPVDDANYVLIELDFADAGRATGFLHFLETQIWATPESSPALDGKPVTRITEAEPLAIV
jgi:hypothetical protein